MNDNAYPIEIRIAAKNGWFTPDEARAWYGHYSRDGIAIHWWGGGEQEDQHDNIVNYELSQAAAGNKSANYIVSDAKITLLVHPNNVAFCTFQFNASTISIEIEPGLSDEGYKKLGWLISQLRELYAKDLWLKGHNTLLPGTTACPGTLDIGRMEAEAQKWEAGGYNPKPTPAPAPTPTPTPAPTPAPAQANLEWVALPSPIGYITNKQPTNLWDFNHTKWPDIKAVKQLAKGDQFTAVARVINHTLNSHYLVTQYSYERRITNGVNESDLTLPVQPTPTPVPPTPEPPKPQPAPSPQPTPSPLPTPTPAPQPDPDTQEKGALMKLLSGFLDATKGLFSAIIDAIFNRKRKD